MNRQLFNALDMTPSKRFWTVLIQVVEKHKTKEAQGNKGLFYRNYVLTDMQDTKVPAVTYAQNIAHVEKLLFPYKRYYISNAAMRDANLEYRLSPYAYTWVLSNKTLIEPLQDNVPHTIPCHYQVTKISELTSLADLDIPVDVKALVIHSYAVYSSTNPCVRDYILIDESKKTMILRLWEDFLDNENVHVSSKLPEPTLIIAKNLKVTTYHGLSLTTRKFAYFIIDPPLQTSETLMDWYRSHTEEISKLIEEKTYADTNKLLPPPNASEIVPLAEVLATIEINCRKSLNAKVDWDITCTSCGEDTVVQPWSRMEIFLSDGTVTLCAAVSGPNAEKLTHVTTDELKVADDKAGPLMKQIEKTIYKKEIICFLKYFERSFGGKAEKN